MERPEEQSIYMEQQTQIEIQKNEIQELDQRLKTLESKEQIFNGKTQQ